MGVAANGQVCENNGKVTGTVAQKNCACECSSGFEGPNCESSPSWVEDSCGTFQKAHSGYEMFVQEDPDRDSSDKRGSELNVYDALTGSIKYRLSTTLPWSQMYSAMFLPDGKLGLTTGLGSPGIV